MKSIGIVNITTVGTNVCINELVAEADRRYGSGNYPEYAVHAIPFAKYIPYAHSQDWQSVAKLILQSIDKLKMIGAKFIIIPNGTAHYAIEEVKKLSPLPVLSLIDIVLDECIKQHYKSALVLGTKSTMQGGLFENPLRQNNIKAVIPGKKFAAKLNDLLVNQVVTSNIIQEDVDMLAGEIKAMQADAIILGCSELPVIYNDKNLERPLIDAMKLLAHGALDASI